jgi:magnesium-protoporphyrin O-methyltransferase
MFDPKLARKDADRYRRKGLRDSARRVLELARGNGLEGAEVLEIGGGVGSLSIELVAAGAAHATVLELSDGYDAAAQGLLEEHLLVGRVEHRLADVVQSPDGVPTADVVVLERVVCCYRDAEALVGAAAAHARRRLVLSYPRYGVPARLAMRGANLLLRARGSEFRVYAHAPATIAHAAEERGLRPAAPATGLVWRVAAFERA